MERSRARRVASRWGWRSLVVTVAAIFFWMSVVGQLAWDLISVLEDPEVIHLDTGTAVPSSLVHCAAQVFMDCKTDPGCAVASAPIGLFAILYGFLSIWWNPKWQHKLQGHEGRLEGLQEYYQVNSAVLLARFGFWVWAGTSATLSSTDGRQIVAHCLVMIMTLVLTIYTFTRVKIDTTPLVSWQDSPVQLLSQRQYNPSIAAGIAPQPFSSRVSRPEALVAQSFPISSLAPEPRRQIWQAPTPPPEEDPDAMEWEPSQTFQPKPRRPKISAPPGPSPFHGALPAMPTNRLLHPQPQRQPPQKEAIGLPPGFFDNRNHLETEFKAASLPPMAQPKFFSKGDREADTGLENIFDTVFSLRDAPAIPKMAAKESLSVEQANPDPNILNLHCDTIVEASHPVVGLSAIRAAKLVIFAVGLITWYLSWKFQPDVPQMKVGIIGIAGMASLPWTLLESRRSTFTSNVSDRVWSGVMVFSAAFLALKQLSHAVTKANQDDDEMAMLFLFLCACWELPRLFDWTPRNSSENNRRTSLKANSLREPRFQGPAAPQAAFQPEILSSNEKIWEQPLSEARSSASQTSRWQPEGFSPIKPALSARAPDQRPSYRTRSDSTDSAASQSSETTAASTTTAGWRTPNLRANYPSAVSGQSPGFNLRSLALHDGVPTPRRPGQNGLRTRSRTRF
jgi:hypothetical protein